MLSLETQIKYLWENRDKVVEPAPAVTSPVATTAPSWLSISGNVAFLAGEADGSRDRPVQAPILLSSHCSLTKDHRMRFRGQANETGDCHLKVSTFRKCQRVCWNHFHYARLRVHLQP